MVACVDGAADVHASTNGPVLLKVGVVAFDRRSVDALLLPDLVCAAIALVTPVLSCAAIITGIVVSHSLDNVVLHQWVIGPAVEGKVSSTRGFECTGIIHQPGKCLFSMEVLLDVRVDLTYISLAGW